MQSAAAASDNVANQNTNPAQVVGDNEQDESCDVQLTEEANIAPPLKTQLSLKKKNYEEPRHDLEMGLPVVDDNPKKQNKD